MEENERPFEQILEIDEELIKAIKPNRSRYVWTASVSSMIIGNLFLIPFFAVPIAGLVGAFNNNGPTERFPFIIFLAFTIFFFLAINSSMFFNAARYKQAYYGITNKRLIVREGFASTSFSSYPLESITSSDVRITFLDKVGKKNTGSLYFYTNGIGVYQNTNTRTGGSRACVFAAVEDPYRVNKQIAELINEAKKK